MMIFDISVILSRVYGTPFPSAPPLIVTEPVAGDFPEQQQYIRIGRSMFDKPLYRDNALGRPEFLPATLEDIPLPNSLVVISGKKTIVETPMVGSDGSVKEIINVQDYIIKIICTEILPDNQWPESALHRLNELYRLNKTLTLQCPLTDVFLQAKDNSVITGISIPDMKGIQNAQVFEISLVSDTYFELELRN